MRLKRVSEKNAFKNEVSAFERKEFPEVIAVKYWEFFNWTINTATLSWSENKILAFRLKKHNFCQFAWTFVTLANRQQQFIKRSEIRLEILDDFPIITRNYIALQLIPEWRSLRVRMLCYQSVNSFIPFRKVLPSRWDRGWSLAGPEQRKVRRRERKPD